MTSIIHFVPKANTPQANLTAFIDAARALLKAYPAVQSWDETSFDLMGVVTPTGRGRGKYTVTFTTFDDLEEGSGKEMSEPFLSFAKAYFLYHQAIAPTKVHWGLMTALKALEKALVEVYGTSHPHLVTPAIFNRATDYLRACLSRVFIVKRHGLALD